MRIAFFGVDGKVGAAIRPALERAGHDIVDGRAMGPAGCDVALDFTRPDAVVGNVKTCLAAGVPVVIGTTGFDLASVADSAVAAAVPCLYAPNFALGAVLMMRFAEEAARVLPRAAIVELHHETKLDAPSGTALETAARMDGEVDIHSIRLPGVLAHQEVILGGLGETLVIRHDTTSREAFAPGVLRAVEAVGSLPPGLTVGLEAVL